MSYSGAESKVSQVASLVGRAEHLLGSLLDQAQELVQMIDRETAGAQEVIAEIDAQAGGGDALWMRLKERKDQVRADILQVRAAAIGCRDDLQARLDPQATGG